MNYTDLLSTLNLILSLLLLSLLFKRSDKDG